MIPLAGLIERSAKPSGRDLRGKIRAPVRLSETETQVNPPIFFENEQPGISDSAPRSAV